MAFTNQFKTLAAVLKHYQIHYKEADFDIIKTATISESVQQMYYQSIYTRGQGPQNNLLNPSAWADFLNGLGTGEYRISP